MKPLRMWAILIALLLLVVSTSLTMYRSHVAHAASITPLHVSGNALVDANGATVILHGANRAGTEYACIEGWGIFDGPNDAASVAAIRSWGINEINIPLNEDCWLGINGVNPSYGGVNYRNAIIAYTRLLESYNIYPVLAYMWGAPGTQQALDHPIMPDADHAPTFWTSVANAFKGDGLAILRLQEEPHPNSSADNTAAWTCWANGGASCSVGYTAVGFKSLMSTVRATGATNVVQVPGVDWANGMTQFLTYKPTDSNEMAVVDVYGDNPCGNPTCFNNEYAPVAAQLPFMAGEFGESVGGDVCGTTADDALMSWFDVHNAGYSMWEWVAPDSTPPCGSLYMILSYDGTPHSPNGVDYKNHLTSLAPPTPSPNLLTNGSFDSGSLSPWSLQVTAPEAGTVALDASTFENGTSSARVNITTAGTDWHVQFHQLNLPITAGRTYTLSFYIKADRSRIGSYAIQKNVSPWTTYSTTDFSVTTTWVKQTFTFTSTVSDTVMLNFNMAQSVGNVWIDAVSLN